MGVCFEDQRECDCFQIITSKNTCQDCEGSLDPLLHEGGRGREWRMEVPFHCQTLTSPSGKKFSPTTGNFLFVWPLSLRAIPTSHGSPWPPAGSIWVKKRVGPHN